MKKYIIGLVVLSLFIIPSFSFAQVGDVDPNPTVSECVALQNNLRYRDRDANKNGEVSTLQDFLQSKGYLNSEPTGYFGLLTFKAVKDFQKENSISPTGYVGAITRAKIKALTCDGVISPIPTIPGCTSDQGYSNTTGKKCTTPSSPSTNPVISGGSGPQSLNVNQTGTWTIKASSSTGGNLSYSVVWGDEAYYQSSTSTSTKSLNTSQSATFTHSYSQAGVYTPTFTVTSENTIRCITTPCPSNEGSAKISLSVNVGNSNAVSVSLMKNTSYPDSQISTNTVNAQIGSFVLTNQSTKKIRLGSFTVQFSYDFVSSVFKNLKIYRDGTQLGYTVTTVENKNYIVIHDYTLAPGSKSTIDIYADVGSWPATLAAKLQAAYYDGIGFFTNESSFTTETATGQNITITSSTLTNNPVISSVYGPQTLNIGQEGKWTVSASDSSGGNLWYSVDWGGDINYSTTTQSVETLLQQSATFYHSYSKAGVFSPTFTVTNTSGQSAKTSLSVNVGNTAVALPVVEIWTDNNNVNYGGSATIFWKSENADTCVASGDWSGTKSLSGSQSTGNLKSTRTYTIKCTNNFGSEIDSITINVGTTIVPPITVLSPNGGETWQTGSTQKISWNMYGNLPEGAKFSVVLNKEGRPPVYNPCLTDITERSCTWTVSADPNPDLMNGGSDYKIKVEAFNFDTGWLYASDESDNYFTISPTNLSSNALSAWNSTTLKPGCTVGANYSTTTGQPCR